MVGRLLYTSVVFRILLRNTGASEVTMLRFLQPGIRFICCLRKGRECICSVHGWIGWREALVCDSPTRELPAGHEPSNCRSHTPFHRHVVHNVPPCSTLISTSKWSFQPQYSLAVISEWPLANRKCRCFRGFNFLPWSWEAKVDDTKRLPQGLHFAPKSACGCYPPFQP